MLILNVFCHVGRHWNDTIWMNIVEGRKSNASFFRACKLKSMHKHNDFELLIGLQLRNEYVLIRHTQSASPLAIRPIRCWIMPNHATACVCAECFWHFSIHLRIMFSLLISLHMYNEMIYQYTNMTKQIWLISSKLYSSIPFAVFIVTSDWR